LPSTSTTASPTTTWRTVIWFWVSVPVLSEQITVVLPRVSTAGSFRMIARRRAIRATPIASVTVTAAGSPSGIAPTASAMAEEAMSSTRSPRNRPIATTTAAIPRIRIRSLWLNAAILRVRGVSRSGAAEIISEMRPISVWSPVATTTPRPWP